MKSKVHQHHFNAEFNAETLVIWRGAYYLNEEAIIEVKERLVEHPDSYMKDKAAEGNIWSSYFIKDIYDRPEIEFLDVYNDLGVVLKETFNMYNSQSSFDYWSQLYDGSHVAHDHYSGENFYSFVHFVEPVGKNFHFLDGYGNKLYPKQDKGDIIVFPSWATHAIDASYGQERFTIAGNIALNTVRIAEKGTQYNNTKVRPNLYILEKLNGSN